MAFTTRSTSARVIDGRTSRRAAPSCTPTLPTCCWTRPQRRSSGGQTFPFPRRGGRRSSPRCVVRVPTPPALALRVPAADAGCWASRAQSKADQLKYEDIVLPSVQLGQTVWAPATMDYSTARLCSRYIGDSAVFLPAKQLARHLSFIQRDDNVRRWGNRGADACAWVSPSPRHCACAARPCQLIAREGLAAISAPEVTDALLDRGTPRHTRSRACQRARADAQGAAAAASLFFSGYHRTVLKSLSDDEQRRVLARWIVFTRLLPEGAPPAALLAARILRGQ